MLFVKTGPVSKQNYWWEMGIWKSVTVLFLKFLKFTLSSHWLSSVWSVLRKDSSGKCEDSCLSYGEAVTGPVHRVTVVPTLGRVDSCHCDSAHCSWWNFLQMKHNGQGLWIPIDPIIWHQKWIPLAAPISLLSFCFLRAYAWETVSGKAPKEMIKADSLGFHYLPWNSTDTRLSERALRGILHP